MANNNTFGPKIAVEGEKQFKDAISGINKDMAVLSSEMRKVTAEYKDNSGSAEALTAKNKILNEQIEAQESKVNLLKGALEKTNQKYGEGSRESKEYEIKLNNAETQLIKFNNELKENKTKLESASDFTKILKNSLNNYGAEADQAKAKTSSFGDSLKANLTTGAIITGLYALGTAIESLGGKVIGAVKETAAYADEILTLEKQTGIATDTLQELYYMQDLTDVSLDTLTTTMARNIRSMNSAKDGTGSTAEAYKKLGISITDTSGNLLDSETVYWNAIDALGEMKNETERDALAMELFGKSAQEINPVIEIGSEGIKKYADEANEMGAVLSGDVLDSLGATDDSLQRMDQQLQVVKRQFGIAFAPAVTKGAEELTDALDDMKDEISDAGEELSESLVNGLVWIIDNIDLVIGGVKGLTTGFIAYKGAAAVGNLITGFNALKTALSGATVAQSGLNVAMSANPVGAIAAAVGLLVGGLTALISITKSAEDEVDELGDKVDDLNSKTQDMLDTMEANAESRLNDATQIETNAAAYENLTEKIFELASQTNLTTGEQTLLNEMIAQLNEAVPNLNLAYDNQTGSLTKTKDAVYGLIEANKQQLLVQASAENLTELYKNLATEQYDLALRESERADMLDKITEKRNAAADAEEKYRQAVKDGYSEYSDAELYAWQAAEDALKQAEENLDKYDEKTGDVQKSISELQAEEAYWRTYISTNGDVEAAKKAMEDYKTSINNTTTAGTQGAASIGDSYANLPAKVNIKDAMAKKGLESTQGFTGAFTSAWNSFVDVTLGGLINKLPASIKKLLKINSPSKVLEELGEFTGEGYEIGVVNSFEKAQKELEKVINVSVDPVNNINSNVNYQTNLKSIDYRPILSQIASLQQSQKNLTAAVTVIVGRRTVENAIRDVAISSNYQNE